MHWNGSHGCLECRQVCCGSRSRRSRSCGRRWNVRVELSVHSRHCCRFHCPLWDISRIASSMTSSFFGIRVLTACLVFL